MIVFALHVTSVCPTVGPGDSGELTVVMTTGGVAHAPGYPLLSLLGNVVAFVAPGEPAFAMNLLSVVLAAACCGVLTSAVYAVTRRTGAAVTAGIALGSSRVFWEYSLVAEVFALNNLMAALLLLLLARCLTDLRDGRVRRRPYLLLGLVMSTAISHHLTLVLVALPVLAVILGLVPHVIRDLGRAATLRTAASSLGVGILGLAPILYLPLAASGDPPLNWGDPRDLGSLWHLLARSDFGSGSLMTAGFAAQQVLDHGRDVSPVGRHLGLFFAEIPRSFGHVLPWLAALGVVSCVVRHRPWAVFFGLAFVMCWVFFSLVNTPLLPLFRGVTERFYILPHVLVAFAAGLGTAWIIDLARDRVRHAAMGIPVVLVAATGVAGIFLNHGHVTMRGNTFTADLGANMMSGLPENALFFAQGDMFHNAFHYRQAVLGERSDVTYVDTQKLSYDWYRRRLARRGGVVLPGKAVEDCLAASGVLRGKAWLDANLERGDGGRPVVLMASTDGSEAADYALVSWGLWARAFRRDDPGRDAVWDIERVANRWALDSLGRSYHERSWETETRLTYAKALCDVGVIAELLFHGAGLMPPDMRPTWFEKAKEFGGPSVTDAWVSARCAMAELRLQRAGILEPSKSRTLALAEGALRLDSTNPDAARAVLAVRGRQMPPVERARLLGVIADAAPGDYARLKPYLEAVLGLFRGATAPARDSEPVRLLRDAVRQQRRMLGRVRAAMEVSDSDVFKKLEETLESNLPSWEKYARQYGL